MQEYTIPEIQRTSLTAVILTLKCLEVHDVIRFSYLDHPEERFTLEALKWLYQCDAIDRRGKVTQLGELMVEFPLPPGLTRALLQAVSLGFEEPPAACSHHAVCGEHFHQTRPSREAEGGRSEAQAVGSADGQL
ncbi:unnamed protein product [Oncorhynchus mykiss]|uniref:Helicase associated domain-containing protein n=1 Tax=Oncorhynchus mykiss TaxID=8022 RepID=A0A060WQV3_ONCMY|nr:unnamed protein product [Oncorhynchus mykiss]